MATAGVVRILCVLLAAGTFGSVLAEEREESRYGLELPHSHGTGIHLDPVTRASAAPDRETTAQSSHKH